MDLGKFLGQKSMDEEFEFLQIDEDDEEILALSHWEFVDASDADADSDRHRQEEESNGSPMSSPMSSPISSPVAADPVRPRPRFVQLLGMGPTPPEHKPPHDEDDEGYGDGGGGGGGGDEDGDDVYGLDDELVPWSVSDKFGRQRMRKLGKRNCPKMNNSKRLPYMLVRPGCVRGKHGLGLKHIY